MSVKIETFKVIAGSVISGIIALLGSNYKLVILLLAIMGIDTILGHLRAIHNREWTSYNARWGFVGKLVEITLVMLMYICEWCFGINWLVNLVVVYFLICEGASIIENIVQGHLNENVPDTLLEILENAKTNGITAIVKKIQDIFGGGK